MQNQQERDVVDQATLELRRKIDEMLQMSQASVDPIPTNTIQSQQDLFSKPLHGQQNSNLRMNDFEFNAPIKENRQMNMGYREMAREAEDKREVQAEVQSIIKNCLMVEDEAAMIKHGRTFKKSDQLYNGEFSKPTLLEQAKHNSALPSSLYSQTLDKKQPDFYATALPPTESEEEKKAIYRSTLNKQQQKLFNQVVSTNDQETAEDFHTAMELLNRYQKDKHCFKKDVDSLKHQGSLVMETTQIPIEEQKRQPPKSKSFNPVLTQNERHKQVQEMREKRIREQQLKRLHQGSSAQYAPPEQNSGQKERKHSRQHQHNSKQARGSSQHKSSHAEQKPVSQIANSDLDSVMNLSRKASKPASRQPNQATQADLNLKKVRQARDQIDQKTQEYQNEYKKVQGEIQEYKKALFEQQKALKQQQTQAEIQKQLAEEKRLTEEKMAKSQQALKDFNLNRLLVTVSSIYQRKARQQRAQAFDAVQMNSLKLKLAEEKVTKQRIFKLKVQIYRNWLLTIKQQKHEKLLQEYEQREQHLLQIEQKLLTQRTSRVLQKVWRSLIKNITISKDERQIEQEHNDRKAQIDNFFANLRQKVDNDKTNQAELKTKQELKDRVRQHAVKFAEENRHLTVENVAEAEVAPFQIQFNPPAAFSEPEAIVSENGQQEDDLISVPSEIASATETFDNQSVITNDRHGIVSEQNELHAISEAQSSQMYETESELVSAVDRGLNRDLISIQTHSHKPSTEFGATASSVLVLKQEASEADQEGQYQQVQMPMQQQEQQPRQRLQSRKRGNTNQRLQFHERPRQVVLMEERAKQRKERRELLNQRYAEKKRIEQEAKEAAELAKEEEFKRKQQEEKDAKKAAKLEEERQKELARQQAEDLKTKMRAAATYHEHQLLIKYGILPFANLIIQRRWKERQAILQYRKALQMIYFKELKTRIGFIRLEREQREKFEMTKARKFCEYKTTRRIFDCLKQNTNYSKAEIQHKREKCQEAYKRALFYTWRKQLLGLREERLTIEAKQDALVQNFRYKRFGRMFIECLQQNIEEMAVEKEKNKFKKAMWSKVSTWLQDLDDPSKQKIEETKESTGKQNTDLWPGSNL